jgi:hypothetical protein
MVMMITYTAAAAKSGQLTTATAIIFGERRAGGSKVETRARKNR